MPGTENQPGWRKRGAPYGHRQQKARLAPGFLHAERYIEVIRFCCGSI